MDNDKHGVNNHFAFVCSNLMQVFFASKYADKCIKSMQSCGSVFHLTLNDVISSAFRVFISCHIRIIFLENFNLIVLRAKVISL